MSNLVTLAHESRNRENVMSLPSHQCLFPDETCHALSCLIAKTVRVSQRDAETIIIEVESQICSTSWREDTQKLVDFSDSYGEETKERAIENCCAKLVADPNALLLIRLVRFAHLRVQLARKSHWD